MKPSELRDKTDPGLVVATKSALLQRDGDVVGVAGYGRILFNVAPAEYFVAVRHRNHLGAMTFAAKALGASETGVDFTLASEATYGTGARMTLANGKQALMSGNTVRDGVLMYTGAGNDRDPILQAIGGVVPTNTATGYDVRDVNLDGLIKYTGLSNDRDPILLNIGGIIPTNTRTEQLP